MLRTTILTLATVSVLMALGLFGHARLVNALRPWTPPMGFGRLQVTRAGVDLTNVQLLHSRVRARARRVALRWRAGVRPTVRIQGLTAYAGPVDATIDRLDADPSEAGWRLGGAGQVAGVPVDFLGQVKLAERSITLRGASGPLFQGRIERADVQLTALRLDASDPHSPTAQLVDVDARRGRAWWGGGHINVSKAPCGLLATLSGGHIWYGAAGETRGGERAALESVPAAPRFDCPVHLADLAVHVASPWGARHIQLHAGDLRPASVLLRASGPEGAGTLVAATDRHWLFADGSFDLAQLPDLAGVSVAGAAHGELALVRRAAQTAARVDARVDGQLTHPAIAPEPVDLSGTTFTLDVAHEAGELAVDVIDVQRGGVHASAQITANATTVDVHARLAPTDCQSLWAAIPTALRGPYADARLSGRVAPRVHFRLPRATPKKLTLEWTGPSDCTVNALATRRDHQPAATVTGARDDVDWLLRDFRLPVRYATRPIEVGPGTPGYVPIAELPRWVGAAAIVSEDNSFNRGKALNLGLLRRALMFNLDRGRYVYGGSTIPQQLAKNLFLTRHKTLARKLQEAIVAMRMVQVVPTRRILELYLNCIEFAPNVYGIERAARHYFQKGARQLTPKESAFLGISKPSPRYAAAMRRRGSTPDTPHFREYMRRILERMRKRGAISIAQEAAARPFRIRWRGGRRISQSENRPQARQL